jgi:hypothetical protein
VTSKLLAVLSLIVTGGLVLATLAIGGIAPLSPAEMAHGTVQARSDLKEAIRNTTITAEQTRAFGTIATNVRKQLDASRRILAIQKGLEQSSKLSVDYSSRVQGRIRELLIALEKLQRDMRSSSALSGRLNDSAAAAQEGASGLDGVLSDLTARFVKVISQSRELNRKARAFAQTGRLP